MQMFSFVLVYHNLRVQHMCMFGSGDSRAFIDVFSESISFDSFGFGDFHFASLRLGLA